MSLSTLLPHALVSALATAALSACIVDDDDLGAGRAVVIDVAPEVDEADLVCPAWPAITDCGEGQDCPDGSGGEPVKPTPERLTLADAGPVMARTIEPAPGAPVAATDGAVADCPGCDGYPDTVCTTYCCAEHDRCYAANGCTAGSWIDGKTDVCDDCNSAVVACIASYGLWGCKIDWPGDGQPAACTTFPCGCDLEECFDARTGITSCKPSC
jgi:hypothetical protein